MRFLHKVRKILIVMMLCVFAVNYGYAAARSWEAVKSERADLKTVGRDGDFEIKTARGVVFLSTSRQVQVRIYTILGQLVSNETVAPGSYQFSVTSHGVYIVKVGDNLTYKVAL